MKKWVFIFLLSISLQASSQSAFPLAAERLSKAIRFPTISYSDTSLIEYNVYNDFIDFIKKTYPLTHQHLQPKIVNRYSLLFTWKGSNDNLLPVLFMAHYDVVPIDTNTIDRWKEEPFSGKINNGYITGRGAVDDKIAIIGLMETCERLLKENFKPQRTIYIAFGHDEEVGGQRGALMISKYLQQQRISFEAIFDEGSAIAKDIFPGTNKLIAFIGVAEKGDMNLLLTLKDKGGHSAAPPKETAINILSEAIMRLRDHPMPARLTDVTKETLKTMKPFVDWKTRLAINHMGLFRKKILKKMAANSITNALTRTVITPTIIKGGTKENILPGYVAVNLNIRILHGDSIGNIIEHINKTVKNDRIKIEVAIPGMSPSPISPIPSSSYSAMKKIIEEQFPGIFVAPVLCIGATDTRHYTSLCKNIFRFTPVVIDNDDKEMIHGYNERISLTALEKAMNFYYELVKKMDQLQ